MDTVSARARSSNAASCSCSQSQTFRRNVSAWDVQSSRRHFRGFVSAPGQPKSQAHLSAPATRENVPVVAMADRDEPFTALAMGLLLGVGSFLVYALGADFANAANLEASREPAFHPVAADIQNLADNEDFWGNLARYGRYFLTVLLGTAYTAIKPLGGLLRRPVTAALTIGAFVSLYLFINATLKGMLGVGQEPLQLMDY